MTPKIATLASIAFLILGCSRAGKVQRGQEQYQVVQEGSASGVTSTINAPGEPAAPATATNVDTTTNFTLPTNPNPLGNDTAGGTVAGALSSNPVYPAGTPGMTPRPRTRRTPTANAPLVTDTNPTAPPMPKTRRVTQPPPSMTDTSETTPMVDPAATTSTDTPKKRNDGSRSGDQQPPPPPPPTDTTSTQGVALLK